MATIPDEQRRAFRDLVHRFKRFREELSPDQRRMMTALRGAGRFGLGRIPAAPQMPFQPFQVMDPYPLDWSSVFDFSQDAAGHIVITLNFAGYVRKGSVVPMQTCIFSSALVPNAPGTVAVAPPTIYDSAITFTTDQTVDQLLQFQPDAAFYLTLVGTNRGQGAVTDQEGVLLDGDYDGLPGGDWVQGFGIVG